MKYLKDYFFILLITSILFNCSSDNSDNKSYDVKGTITLSGEEATELGGSLEVGNIIEGAAQTGTSHSVTLLDKNVNTQGGEINPTDPLNTFIIVTAQFENNSSATKTISMAINVNGKEYKYACISPNTGTFTGCGNNFEVNQTEKKVIFNNTTVINTVNDKILTLNGVVTWN